MYQDKRFLKTVQSKSAELSLMAAAEQRAAVRE